MREDCKDISEAQYAVSRHSKHQNKYTPLLRAYLYSLNPQYRKMSAEILENYHLPLLTPPAQRALYHYLIAGKALYETDMLNASTHAYKALNIYQKLGFIYEKGETSLLLAQIYRITGIFDIADTMLQEAKKCFRQLGFSAKMTETIAYAGLLELNRENFDAGIKSLKEAADIAVKNKLTATYADILNWLGLAYYLKNDIPAAEENFKTAYKNATAPAGQYYAAEMLARIKLKTEDFKEALHHVNKAVAIGKNLHNPDMQSEILYLKAEIHHKLQQNGQSAQILTNLIRQKRSSSSPFYIANAYTLLGLIKLQKNELTAAKTLFKQAVDLEHGRNRLKGAAIDYNNLAVISRLEGNTKEADMYLKQALAYAEEINDEELKNSLKTPNRSSGL